MVGVPEPSVDTGMKMVRHPHPHPSSGSNDDLALNAFIFYRYMFAPMSVKQIVDDKGVSSLGANGLQPILSHVNPTLHISTTYHLQIGVGSVRDLSELSLYCWVLKVLPIISFC